MRGKVAITIKKLGDQWYVFLGGKNVLMGHATEAEARAAADTHFAKGRKKAL